MHLDVAVLMMDKTRMSKFLQIELNCFWVVLEIWGYQPDSDDIRSEFEHRSPITLSEQYTVALEWHILHP